VSQFDTQVAVLATQDAGTFSEDWGSPDSYDKLTPQQKQAYSEIARVGLQACPGPIIQKVIELAVEFKKNHSKQ
jgi:hypothetical protein